MYWYTSSAHTRTPSRARGGERGGASRYFLLIRVSSESQKSEEVGTGRLAAESRTLQGVGAAFARGAVQPAEPVASALQAAAAAKGERQGTTGNAECQTVYQAECQQYILATIEYHIILYARGEWDTPVRRP